MKKYLIVFIALALASCSQTSKSQSSQTATTYQKSENEHQVLAAVWFQQSAEMKALYHQGYNLAKLMLDKHLVNTDKSKKNCVIVDIDETILDNSPFTAKGIETGIGYNSENWKEWTDHATAKALPGAVEFLQYAASKGVETFYISNRKTNEIESSMKNLKEAGFPGVDTQHIMFKETSNSKTERRAKVAQDYNILLLIGDQLTDFTEIFENRDASLGFNLVEQHKAEFGDRYIILPNPMYGEWENAIYEYNFKLSNSEKAEKRRKILKSF
jgi:5'-nucleotidase (lipoprotein e(P4) family)